MARRPATTSGSVSADSHGVNHANTSAGPELRDGRGRPLAPQVASHNA
ncbi:hypothetical protein LCGC14_3002530, partial [marine sediment metagenome]